MSTEKQTSNKLIKATSSTLILINKKKRKKIILYISLIVVLIAAICGLTFKNQIAFWLFKSLYSEDIDKAFQHAYVPIDNVEPQIAIKDKEPFSLLLLGVDQREQEAARSDAIIYAVVRPNDSKLLLVSIPRDTYVDIVGKNYKDKVNAAFAFGGAKMSIETIEQFLGNPAHYYATINFNGLIDVVDTIGGVKLPITKDIVNKSKYHDKFTIEANKPRYYGVDALNYVRYREDSDFYRTERQRIFIGAMIKEMMTIGNLSKIDDLIKIGGENFTTNMKADDITDWAETLVKTTPEISNYMIDGYDEYINKLYYYMPRESSLEALQLAIKSWLDPKAEAIDLEILLQK
ncbi:LCP family protein [Paenibacillus endoradicis]|uniref:LCP family protein n=1 Tax=Paenibacillus endoradicis TaxID=2972487 RepID=UPI0021595E27|nr:LCP family protein [Paenibacillus endoradicis]MCR8658614.1 LCP family protein [Paenibacillus endoradicis]